jgi:hypothetical protein
MNVLGIVIFILLFGVITGAVVYVALFKSKEEEKKKDPSVTVNTDGQCIDCGGKPIPNPTETVVPLSVSISPHNPPEVPADVLCTRSLGAYAVYTGLVTKIEWFDVNLGIFVPVGDGTNYLKNENWLFVTHHSIKCRVSNDSGQWAETTKEIV